MKRTRKIRNGGNPKYYVCEMKFIPFLNIILINSIMWIKRQWRRFTRLLKCCKYSLLLLPLWLIFSFFVYWGDFCRGQSFSYADVLWELKTAIFTSVVLAAFTAILNERAKIRDSYSLQHTIYTSFMYKCSELAKALLLLITDNSELVDVPFWPFYESKTMDMPHKEFAKAREYDINSRAADITRFCLRNVKDGLHDVIHNCDNGKIMDIDSHKFTKKSNECLEELDRLEKAIFLDRQSEHLDICICSCLDELYNLIELIRFPWRRDMNNREKILRIMYRENPNMGFSYYDEAVLGIVDYNFYALMSDPEEFMRFLKENWFPDIETVAN